ncbi:hypothetical protein N7491_008917 [Penicillium cf. griseofulvum]|uniref:Uncharacterized protein n=1 Tax=Penicillium cf. griseofulvum TaxID=2972120 RepID=A0A9W9JPT4_9EURO|nr:hypothetical protein N7472_005486 [Penicillium cf. griseofulvum]KAJ5423701.1 hypothetical protein N7491_008917 [Penicillium cf. griseofulvum]KAJ5431045.1 hypothetical protein N7445_008777 [Penicillium cf. griseofulvum]
MPTLEFTLFFCTTFLLGLIVVASYRSPSLTLLAMGDGNDPVPRVSSVVDKQCSEQVVVYLLENAVQIMDTLVWLWFRFYIIWHAISLLMDGIIVPAIILLAKKAYG